MTRGLTMITSRCRHAEGPRSLIGSREVYVLTSYRYSHAFIDSPSLFYSAKRHLYLYRVHLSISICSGTGELSATDTTNQASSIAVSMMMELSLLPL